jgi:hypothetical protein
VELVPELASTNIIFRTSTRKIEPHCKLMEYLESKFFIVPIGHNVNVLILLFSFLSRNLDMRFLYVLFHSPYNSTLVACIDYYLVLKKRVN